VVHRDVKPENILLDEEGNAYLSDFGIAKDLQRATGTTESGVVTGSVSYISPEQARGDPVTAQSDLYSLGVVVFEVLTGQHPFPDAGPATQLIKHLTEPLPPLRAQRPDLPESLEAVIQRVTAKDPEERYADVLSFAAAFREAVSGPTTEPSVAVDWAAAEMVNPYKGLRPFEEVDAADFFGRDALVAQLLERLGEEGDSARFLAVVGPSGSGKSSVVKAGLLPALRRGALPGSQRWYVVEMLPGSHPLDELEIGLLRIAVDKPPGLMEQLQRDERGLLRAARLTLPTDDSELLLVIDQFEEIFTRAVDQSESAHLLQSICAAVSDPRSPVRVIITLRADFYDRPLMHPEFSQLMRQRTEVVVPLTAEELTEAICGPAERAGAELESGLVAAIVSDVREQPGALPMLQYALTELFDRREGRLLTRQDYREIGGVSGALARRAEEVYAGLGAAEQAAARQLFLRLVTLGEGVEDTRRRVLRGELRAVEVDQAAMDAAIDAFGRSRLLLFDRDPATREPTVEVAHEALLREWRQLREWLDESRADVRMERILAAAAEEWSRAKRDASFLLRGTRLAQFEGWVASSAVSLTQDERAYLEASVAERQAREAEEAARQQRELEAARKLAEAEHQRAEVQARAARRLRWGAIALAGLALVAAVLAVVAFRANSAAQREAAVNHSLMLASSSEQALENGYSDLALALALESTSVDEPPAEAVRALSTIALGPGTRMVLAGHDNAVRSVAFSPDGQFAVSGSCEQLDGDECLGGEWALWDLETGEPQRYAAHTGWINGLSFSPDGRTVLSASSDGTLALWGGDGGLVRTFRGHAAGVNDVVLGPDGQTALSASDDATLILWDVATGEVIRRFEGHTDAVTRVALSRDGQNAMSGSADTTLILWDVATGEPIRRFEGHGGSIFDVAFDPDRLMVLSTGDDMSLRLWDLETAEELRQRTFPGGTGRVVINPDGRTAVATMDFEVLLWDIEQWREGWRLLGHTIWISALAVSQDGRLALSGASDGTMRLWNRTGQDELRRFVTDGTPLTAVDVSPDGRYLLAGDFNGETTLWDIERGEEVRRFRSEASIAPGAVAFSPDGRAALVGCVDVFGDSGATSLVLWEVESGEEAGRFEGHRTGLRSVAFSPDGRTALAGSQNLDEEGEAGDLILWDVESGDLIRRFDTTEDITGIAFSADGSRALASSAYSFNLMLFDVATGEEIRRFEGHEGPVFTVAFSPDERGALSSAEDATIVLWDIETGEVIRRYRGHDRGIWAFDISPDGRYLISGSGDGVVILWDFETGEELRRFSSHTEWITDIAFSPDSQTAFSVSADGAIIQWQIADQPLDELTGWVTDNRYIRELTCDERVQYHVEPFCDAGEDPMP
jgi:WD40 repeat protein